MAAKQVLVFLPDRARLEAILHEVVAALELTVDIWPPGKNEYNRVTAFRGSGKSVLGFEYDPDGTEVIQDLLDWERPGRKYKEMIASCKPYITIYYRDRENARIALITLGSLLPEIIEESVLENGNGCLLDLSSVVTKLRADKSWDWERTSFPELPDVGVSEWVETKD